MDLALFLEATVAVSDPLDRLVNAAIAAGQAELSRLTRVAVARLLTGGGHSSRLFTDAELLRLAELLAAVRATTGLFGRSQILGRIEVVAEEAVTVKPAAPLPPEDALAYFRKLFPQLGIDPLRFGEDMRRHAFTLAVATDAELLSKVKGVIADRLTTGEVTTGPRAVQAILDAAGVAPVNPQYADAVFRTNAMDSYNQGLQDELTQAAEMFPVWRYSNPTDSRSRPSHAEKDGNYYPTSIPFAVVRGTGPEDVINCRCVQIPVDKWDWADLQKRGVRLSEI